MGILDGLECLAWKTNPMFWQGVAAIKVAQSAGAITNHDQCMQVAQAGGDVADQFGIPSFLGGSFGKCACDFVFNGNEPATPPNPLISFPVFSAEFYLGIYPDLQAAFGSQGYAAATQHWQNIGSSHEGRRSSPAFDVRYYLSNNADLIGAFGPSGYSAAISHWAAHEGTDETRRSADIFDVTFYLNKYPDLVKAFGAGLQGAKSATLHWVTYGVREGRQGSPDFDPQYYLANNPDLVQAFGAKGWWKATIHWLAHGRGEGRKGIP